VSGAAARWARLTFTDIFGGTHEVLLPAAQLPLVLERGLPVDGSILEGRTRQLEVDMLLAPDPATVVDLGDGRLRVVCSVNQADGAPWAGDPRVALINAVEAAGDLGAGYQASAELEFYLLSDQGVPMDRTSYFGELSGPGAEAVRMIAERLAELGVEVVSAHAEAGPGQYEIDLAPLAPLALADTLMLTKSVVREVAAAAGLTATFMARPLGDEAGSGLHIHQHITDHLITDTGDLDAEGRAFVGGLLAHASGLTALAAPNVNSYKRLHSGPEAPGPVLWGHHNRAAVVRVGAAYDGRTAVEFRLADPAANPYLLLTGLLAAAADGLDRDLDPGTPVEEDVGGYDPARATTIPVRMLPRHLDDALDALVADDVLTDAFDDGLIPRLVDGRRAEAQAYRSQVTTWEVARFLNEA